MPIRSMTGYGRAVEETATHRVSVEIRAVNHRFAEYQFRLSRDYLGLEDVIRRVVADHVIRGRCDIHVTVDALVPPQKQVRVNWDLLSQLSHVQQEADRRGLSVDMTSWFGELGVIEVDARPVDVESFAETAQMATTQACASLISMREREGARLRENLLQKVGTLRSIQRGLAERAPALRDETMARLRERLLAFKLEVSEERLLSEAVLVSERAAIDEEVVRLASHLDELSSALQSEGAVGRRLDFIAQELHREVNTIGAKSNDLTIGQMVLDAKTCVEQIREQVQNLE